MENRGRRKTSLGSVRRTEQQAVTDSLPFAFSAHCVFLIAGKNITVHKNPRTSKARKIDIRRYLAEFAGSVILLVELLCTSTGQSLQPHAEAEDIVVLNAVSLFKTKDEIKFPVICVSSKKVKKETTESGVDFRLVVFTDRVCICRNKDSL